MCTGCCLLNVCRKGIKTFCWMWWCTPLITTLRVQMKADLWDCKQSLGYAMSTCCSGGGPGFNSQHSHGDPQPSVTPVYTCVCTFVCVYIISKLKVKKGIFSINNPSIFCTNSLPFLVKEVSLVVLNFLSDLVDERYELQKKPRAKNIKR